MGACATKPGDLKVKGDAPLVVEDAAAAPTPQAAADEKAPKAVDVPVAVAAEVDQPDVSRRRSLSVLLKQDAEASDGEDDADHQEAEKVVSVAEEEPATAATAAAKVVGVAEEPASAAGAAAAAGETTTGSPEAPVQASVATTELDDTAEEPKDDVLPSGDGDSQAVEEEKQVDPESVQVAAASVADADADAAPSSQESKVADGAGAAA